jgi:L-threonylcarbamoyladenylate synthase
MITAEQAATFERCMAVGGIAVFGADTVYGLACDVASPDAVERLYAIKGRRPDKPAAVMFFNLDLALAALPELGPRTTAALEGLLPGAVTLLLPNPSHRFPLACGAGRDGLETVGLRVPALAPSAAALAAVRWPVLQSSANPAGGAEARRLEDIPAPIRAAADLLLDAGALDGTASTVIDLRRFEDEGAWDVIREGAVAESCVAATLSSL